VFKKKHYLKSFSLYRQFTCLQINQVSCPDKSTGSCSRDHQPDNGTADCGSGEAPTIAQVLGHIDGRLHPTKTGEVVQYSRSMCLQSQAGI